MAINRENVFSNKAAGQGLAELALVLPVLVIIAAGLFDVGRAFYTLIVINNASREGARYLTFRSDDSTNTPAFSDTKAAAVKEAQNSFITLTPSDVTVTGCVDADRYINPGCDPGTVVSGCVDSDGIPGCDTETSIRVRVTHIYRPIFWMPVNMTLSRATQMLIP